MFIEHRTYTLRPGSATAYLDAYQRGGGLSVHETMAPCVGWYTIEAGDLFRLVTMWRFNSFEERLERRAALAGDPRWQAIMAEVQPLVTDIRSNLVVPAPFFATSERGAALLKP